MDCRSTILAADDAYDGSPFVTVVLPVRNEAANIAACLDGLRSQDYPAHRYEILVVDGRSDDETRDIVAAYEAEHPVPMLRLIDNPDRTVPPALNRGIDAARGDVVVRMDGHTVPASDYVRRCVEALLRTGAGNVGGCISPASTQAFGGAVAIAMAHPLGAGDAKFHGASEAQDADTVYLGAFPRRVLEHVGGFDETMLRNQDYEMNVRIRAAGFRVHLDPSIRSTYSPRATPLSLWRQYFQYGWWRVVTLRRHPHSLLWRQVVPPVFVGVVVVLSLIAPFTQVARWCLTALLTPYLVAIGGATVDVARSRSVELRTLLWFPVVIVLLHFSWGTGFLLSLLSGSTFPYPRPGPPRIPDQNRAA